MRYYIKDGRIKFAAYYALVVGALAVLWATAPGAFMHGGFLTASLLLGVGLGADVVGATIGRFQILNSWSARCMWAYRTAASHTMVAMIGLFVCVVLAAWSPGVAAAIRIGGLIAIIAMLAHEGFEQRAARKEAAAEVPAVPASRESIAVRPADWGLVLAVSIDAAICMPTQNAVISEWSHSQIIFAMLLVGVVVGLCAVAGGVAVAIVANSGERKSWLPQLERWGYLTEVLVMTFIGWRGVLPLWIADAHVVVVTLACSLFTTAVFGFLFAPRGEATRQITAA
jgi:hypothetical protein